MRNSAISSPFQKNGAKAMELILSVAFGVWFVLSAIFYGYMSLKGEKE